MSAPGHINASPWTYQAGHSVVHRMDVRCKLVCMCLLSLAVIQAGTVLLTVFTLGLVILLFQAGYRTAGILYPLRFFFLLLAVIILSRALSTDGRVLLSVAGTAITLEGLLDGGVTAWRFFLIMLLGILFSGTTPPSRIRPAVEQLLRFVPMVPEKRAGIMVSLFIRFLPMMLRQADQVRLAQRARCIHLRKHPLIRMRALALPMVRGITASADQLALAMTARCYQENLRPDLPPLTRLDRLLLLGAVIIFCLTLWC